MKMIKNRNCFLDRRKAQLKIGESIIVLVIFFILLVMGMIFYAKIQSRINAQEQDEFNAKRAIDMALAIKTLPELQCTTQSIEEFDCIDLSKLVVLQNMLIDKPAYVRYYAQMFPNSKATIKQAFAPFGAILPSEGIILFDNFYTDEAGMTSLKKLALPVTLFDPISDAYSFGFIELEIAS